MAAIASVCFVLAAASSAVVLLVPQEPPKVCVQNVDTCQFVLGAGDCAGSQHTSCYRCSGTAVWDQCIPWEAGTCTPIDPPLNCGSLQKQPCVYNAVQNVYECKGVWQTFGPCDITYYKC